jgi:hypothetical protein
MNARSAVRDPNGCTAAPQWDRHLAGRIFQDHAVLEPTGVDRQDASPTERMKTTGLTSIAKASRGNVRGREFRGAGETAASSQFHRKALVTAIRHYELNATMSLPTWLWTIMSCLGAS